MSNYLSGEDGMVCLYTSEGEGGGVYMSYCYQAKPPKFLPPPYHTTEPNSQPAKLVYVIKDF